MTYVKSIAEIITVLTQEKGNFYRNFANCLQEGIREWIELLREIKLYTSWAGTKQEKIM